MLLNMEEGLKAYVFSELNSVSDTDTMSCK